ncbi:pyridoxal 5'-phosphate synthase glutaminase subunit PdxT [candidate division KSB1 bacterium]
MSSVCVGILALQGAYEKHKEKCDWLGIDCVYVRSPEELQECSHLIIPGGESTTISKLISIYGFRDELKRFSHEKYIWGTCAGMILLASRVDDSRIENLGLIDIHILRNGYGRQVDSFVTEEKLSFIEGDEKFRFIFIRAPKLLEYGDSVTVLGSINGDVVIARNKNILVSSFHPELTSDSRIHDYFINKMGENK